MRILQINTHALGGGAAQVARTLHETYRTLGHDAHLLTGFGKADPKQGIHVLCPNFPHRLANVLAYRATSKDGAFLHAAWKKTATPLMQQADAIHLHNAHGYYMPKNIRAQLLDAPLTWTLHDEWLMTGRCGFSMDCNGYKTGCQTCPNLHAYPKTWNDHAAQDFTLRRQWIKKHPHIHFITPSHNFKQRLAKAGITPQHITALANPVESTGTPSFKPLNEKPWNLLFIADRPALKRKGLNILLKALAQTAQPETFHLTIIGEINENEKKQHTPLPCPTTWIGPLQDREQIHEAYRTAHLTVVPSLQETFGLTAVEGLLYTGRTICSDLPVLREALQNNGWFVPPNDTQALAQKLDNLNAYKKTNAHQTLAENLQPKKVAQRYINIFKQTTNAQTTP